MNLLNKNVNPYRLAALIATGIMIVVVVFDALRPAPVSAYPLAMQIVARAFIELQMLTPEDVGGAGHLGNIVAIDGDTAIIAGTEEAPNDEISSVYVMNRVGGEWKAQQQLTSNSTDPYDIYGAAMDISGDTILVSDVAVNEYAGAVFVYGRENNLWTEQQMLIADDGAIYDYFGTSLALDGDTAIIGSPYQYRQDVTSQGAVYVFERQNGIWTQIQKLFEPNVYSFGDSVALQNNTAMVTIWGDNAVYVYDKVGSVWERTQILSATDGPGMLPPFGHALAIDGDTAMISTDPYYQWNGSPFIDPTVYVFRRQSGSWSQIQKLIPSDRETLDDDHFGTNIALQGDVAVIGDYTKGSFYIFKNQDGTWTEQQKMIVDPDTDGYQTMSLALNNGTIMAGSRRCDEEHPLPDCQGVVYVFNDPQLIPTATFTLTPVPTTEGPHLPTATATPVTETPIAVTSSPTSTETNPSATVTSTLTSTPPSDNQTELLDNGGFELNANGNQSPDGWKLKHASGDKLKCNDGAEVIAYEGICAFQFKGGDDENSKLQQDVDLVAHAISIGDTLTLGGQIWAKGNVDSKVTLKVKYGTLPTAKIVVDVSPTGKQWMTFSALQPNLSLTTAETPTEITLQIKNNSASGKVRYDALRLTNQSSTLTPLGLP